MLFAFGLDSGFVMPTGVAIKSLDRFLSPEDRIAVLSSGLSEGQKADLSACATNALLQHYDCTGSNDPSWVHPAHLTGATYYRYLIPTFLSDDGRCVYLDGDTVVRHDPRPLHDVALRGCSVAAVRSRVAPFIASPGGVRRWLELGLPSAAPFFNAGVLVMDLDAWRTRNVVQRATAFLRDYGADTWTADQEALNAVAVGDWIELDRTWNYVTHVAESFLQQPELEPADPSIVHFAGRLKPWTYGRMPLFADEWFRLLHDSPWTNFRPSPPVPKRGLRAVVARTAAHLVRAARRVIAESS